jgi:hypothetical protein
LLLAALALVASCGTNVPYSDEWEEVPVLTGEQPLNAAWLWSQHLDHRIPLAKLIWIGLLQLTGHDFRAGMVLNVLALAALALALVLTARALRGWTSYSDAFLPLAVLNPGQYENFLWSWQVAFVCSTVLAGTVLVVIVRNKGPLSPGAAALAGACVLLLPLVGANGLALVPALALWLGYAGFFQWSCPEPQGKRYALFTWTLTTAALLLVALYFYGYARPAGSPPHPGLRASLRTIAQFLSGGLGPAAAPLWPLSGVVLLGVLLLSGGVLLVIWLRQPQDRFRVVGLLLFFGAMASLALGIGWARAGEILWAPDPGFHNRYVTLAVPLLCGVYFCWVLYRGPGGRLAQVALLVLLCLLFQPNVRAGLAGATALRKQCEAFEQDLLAGTPPFILAERHGDAIYWSGEKLAAHLKALHQVGLGRFRLLQPDPVWREEPVPVEPAEVSHLTWRDGLGQGLDANSSLTFSLPEPRFVYAIRLKCSYGPTGLNPPRAVLRLLWRKNGQKDFTRTVPEFLRLPFPTWRPDLPMDRALSVTIWVKETVDEFRIHPDDKPFVVKLASIDLLVPARDGRESSRP